DQDAFYSPLSPVLLNIIGLLSVSEREFDDLISSTGDMLFQQFYKENLFDKSQKKLKIASLLYDLLFIRKSRNFLTPKHLYLSDAIMKSTDCAYLLRIENLLGHTISFRTYQKLTKQDKIKSTTMFDDSDSDDQDEEKSDETDNIVSEIVQGLNDNTSQRLEHRESTTSMPKRCERKAKSKSRENLKRLLSSIASEEEEEKKTRTSKTKKLKSSALVNVENDQQDTVMYDLEKESMIIVKDDDNNEYQLQNEDLSLSLSQLPSINAETTSLNRRPILEARLLKTRQLQPEKKTIAPLSTAYLNQLWTYYKTDEDNIDFNDLISHEYETPPPSLQIQDTSTYRALQTQFRLTSVYFQQIDQNSKLPDRPFSFHQCLQQDSNSNFKLLNSRFTTSYSSHNPYYLQPSNIVPASCLIIVDMRTILLKHRPKSFMQLTSPSYYQQLYRQRILPYFNNGYRQIRLIFDPFPFDKIKHVTPQSQIVEPKNLPEYPYAHFQNVSINDWYLYLKSIYGTRHMFLCRDYLISHFKEIFIYVDDLTLTLSLILDGPDEKIFRLDKHICLQVEEGQVKFDTRLSDLKLIQHSQIRFRHVQDDKQQQNISSFDSDTISTCIIESNDLDVLLFSIIHSSQLYNEFHRHLYLKFDNFIINEDKKSQKQITYELDCLNFNLLLCHQYKLKNLKILLLLHAFNGGGQEMQSIFKQYSREKIFDLYFTSSNIFDDCFTSDMCPYLQIVPERTLELFLLKLYDCSTNKSETLNLSRQTFAQHSLKFQPHTPVLQHMPPTNDTFKQICLRTQYLINIWNRVFLRKQMYGIKLDPKDYGYLKCDDNNYKLKWSNKTVYPNIEHFPSQMNCQNCQQLKCLQCTIHKHQK
ncbi:unnamed protein product, partial [Didymodactylos carnosus]